MLNMMAESKDPKCHHVEVVRSYNSLHVFLKKLYEAIASISEL